MKKLSPLMGATLVALFTIISTTYPATADAATLCSAGKIEKLLVRGNSGGSIEVVVSTYHTSNYLKVPASYSDEVKNRLLSTLMAAFLAGKKVQLQMTSSQTCGYVPQGTEFSYVLVL